MKYRNIYVLMAALSLLSCTKEKERDLLPAEGQMRFAVTVEGSTKASMTDADLKQFYLKVKGPDAAFSFFDSIVKDEQGNWNASSKRLLWKDKESAITYAAASYGALAYYDKITVTDDLFTSGAVLPVLADQSTQDRLKAADLLTMKESESLAYADTEDGVIPITLKHGLSKVNFVLTLDGKFYDNGIGLETDPLTDVVVSGVKRSFDFKPMTGEVSVPDTVQTGTVVPFAGGYVPGTEAAPAAKATYECILAPQELAEGALKLYFSIGTEDFEWTNAQAIELAQGKEYTVLVSVKYKEQTPEPTPVTPEGALSGKFSVSATKQVHFAKGNLQAEVSSGSATSWSFASNQYDYIGTTTANKNPLTSNGTIDLFGWSADANGNYAWGVGSDNNYSSSKYAGNFKDWGATMGDDSGWRTLTKDEWVYLINANNAAEYRQLTIGSDKKAPYGQGTVNGVKGLIILPDDWDGSVHSDFIYGKSSWSNSYTEETTPKWSKMEAAGAVFLPAAGNRIGTNVNVGVGGDYWSSTSGGTEHAYSLVFDDDGVYLNNKTYRYGGRSVRLVCDASAAGGSGPIKALDPFTSGGNPLQ